MIQAIYNSFAFRTYDNTSKHQNLRGSNLRVGNVDLTSSLSLPLHTFKVPFTRIARSVGKKLFRLPRITIYNSRFPYFEVQRGKGEYNEAYRVGQGKHPELLSDKVPTRCIKIHNAQDDDIWRVPLLRVPSYLWQARKCSVDAPRSSNQYVEHIETSSLPRITHASVARTVL